MTAIRIADPTRRDRLLLISALAMALLTWLAMVLDGGPRRYARGDRLPQQ